MNISVTRQTRLFEALENIMWLISIEIHQTVVFRER